jgi:hypothetical protein
MTRSSKLLSGLACLSAFAITMTSGLAIPQARAQCCVIPIPDDFTDFSLLYLDPNLQVINANISGNIGIGQGGGFIGSGSGTVAGTVMFAATSGLFSPDGIALCRGLWALSRVRR